VEKKDKAAPKGRFHVLTTEGCMLQFPEGLWRKSIQILSNRFDFFFQVVEISFYLADGPDLEDTDPVLDCRGDQNQMAAAI